MDGDEPLGVPVDYADLPDAVQKPTPDSQRAERGRPRLIWPRPSWR